MTTITDEEADASFLSHLEPIGDPHTRMRLLNDLRYWVKLKKRIERQLETDTDETARAIYIGRVGALTEWANIAILNLVETGDELLITREIAESEFAALLAIEAARLEEEAADEARCAAARKGSGA